MTSFALRAGVLAGGVLTGFVAQAPEVAAQQSASPPDFSLNKLRARRAKKLRIYAGSEGLARHTGQKPQPLSL